MTAYLLDTNACIHFLNRTHESLVERVLEEGPSRLSASTLTVAELHFGAARSRKPKANLERLRVFLEEVPVEPFSRSCAETFGRLKAALLKAGTPMADFDIAIAASAVALGRTLVTSDGDFRHVPHLSSEDWT